VRVGVILAASVLGGIGLPGVGGGQRVRQIDAGWTGGPVPGLRAAIGAGLLAVGWLVLGAVAGGASAAELEIGDGSLLGPDSNLTVVVEPIHGVGTDASPSVATPATDDASVVAGLPVLSGVADAATVQKFTEPVLESVEPVLKSVEPVLAVVEPALESVEPVLETVEPVLEAVEPLESVELVLDVIEPVLESVEPVLEAVGVEATVFGKQSESIQVAPEPALAVRCGAGCDPGAAEPPTYVRGDFRSTNTPSAAAIAMADPARHAPGPSAPLAPLIPTETVAPGASGSIALPGDVAQRGWASCASTHTMPPGNDIAPAAPAFDSDSTPD
jgi:hypothetical protein